LGRLRKPPETVASHITPGEAVMFRSLRQRSDIRDMPQGIGIEEFSHLEMVGKTDCAT
jgi:hypothetical protein